MNLPKRLKRPKMGLRESSVIRCPGHLKWVRGHECCITGRLQRIPERGPWDPSSAHTCEGHIEAMHVRTGTDGGIGMKPSDCWAIPGCSKAHREQHQIGEHSFERLYGIDMKLIAEQLWRVSPHGNRYRRERG